MKTKWQDLLPPQDRVAEKREFDARAASADPVFDAMFPARIRGSTLGSRYVAMLLDRLAEFEAETTPLNANASGKDLKAFQALQYAGALVEAVAGWAIRHQIGTAIEGLGFVPLGPQQTRDTDAYKAAKAAVDDHRHEKQGNLEPGSALRDDQIRQAIINILEPMLTSYSWSRGASPVMAKCVGAFQDIQHGFPPALTDISRPKGIPTSYMARRLQLSALGFIEYRRVALRMTETAAREAVGDAFGCADTTIRDWDRGFASGSSPFGPLELEREKQFARNSASYALAAQVLSADEMTRHAAMASEEKYGEAALKRAANAYNAVRPHRQNAQKKRGATRRRKARVKST